MVSQREAASATPRRDTVDDCEPFSIQGLPTESLPFLVEEEKSACGELELAFW